MERIFGEDVSVRLGRLERDLNEVLAAFVDPWVLIQFTLVIAALLAGIVLGRFVERVLEQRVRLRWPAGMRCPRSSAIDAAPGRCA